MRRLIALVLFAALPLLAELPPGVSRVTFSDELYDAMFFSATPDDSLWVSSFQRAGLERIGSAATPTLPTGWKGTDSMGVGPDGALWLAGGYWLVRVDPATNAIQTFAQGIGTGKILSGPDGNLWLLQGYSVTRMQTDGRILWKFYVGPMGDAAFGTDGALYIAAPGKLLRVTAAAETTTLAAAPNPWLFAGQGFLWSVGEAGKDVLKLSYSGEILDSYRTGMQAVASDALGNLWLRSKTGEGEIVGQLTPNGVLTRFGPLPLIPSTQCFPSWDGGAVFLADGRVAISDYYPILPRIAIAPNPCWDARKPADFRNTVTIFDPRLAPVMSVEQLNPAPRRRVVRR